MSTARIFPFIDVVATASSSPTARSEVSVSDAPKPSDALSAWRAAGDGGASLLRNPTPTLQIVRLPLPDPPDTRLVMLREGTSHRARSYRLLRHRLLSHGDPRVIAVTSARPAEGKTTCAANLAIALAEDTMTSVLLLEANLLRPALGRMLGFEASPSVVADMVLFARVGPPYPVAALDGARLHVAALPGAALPAAHLDRTLLSVALLDLRSAYDYIVIDAASALESGDMDIVGEASDGVLVVTRAARTRRTDLRRALRHIHPANVLGTVLLDA